MAEVSPIEDLRIVSGIDPNAVAIDRKAKNVGVIGDFASETLAILEENGLADKPVGVVGIENLATPFYEFLSSQFGDKLKRVPDIVARLRSVKSPAEVERMRLAAQLSDLGFETMLKAARPGMSGVELVAEMERAVRGAGADIVKYWMASGPAPDWADSRIDIKPHERELQVGDLAVIQACFKLPGSGKMFIPLGDVCHVTPEGPEFLMEFQRTLFVAGT